jgi:hypothetical protein
MAQLAARPALTEAVLAELADWRSAPGQHPDAAVAGREAFLLILASDVEGSLPWFSPERWTWRSHLAAGWHDVSRDPSSIDRAFQLGRTWLDAAAADPDLLDAVCDVLVRACRSNNDRALAIRLVMTWALDGHTEVAPERRPVEGAVMNALLASDPLRIRASATGYRAGGSAHGHVVD